MQVISPAQSTEMQPAAQAGAHLRRWNYVGLTLFALGFLAAIAAIVVWPISALQNWGVDAVSLLLILTFALLMAACHCVDCSDRCKQRLP